MILIAFLFFHLFGIFFSYHQYEMIANAYQDYVPCSDYRTLVESHIQKGTEFIPEKYHFDGFHESKYVNLMIIHMHSFVECFSYLKDSVVY